MSVKLYKENYSKYYRISEYRARDAFYNWLVKKYEEKNRPWTTQGLFNDKWFWSTFLDQVWPWVPVLVFIYVIYFLVTWTYDNKGIFYAIVVLAIMVLMRVNVLIKKIDMTNRILNKKL